MENNKTNKRQDYLTAIYQNTSTAIQSINDLMPKVVNKELKQELKKELKEYGAIKKKCEAYAEKYEFDAQDNNIIEKAKLWTSIKLTTLMDASTRHIAEMLLIGTNMGIFTCYKDKYDHRGVDDDLDSIIEILENLEIKNIESLKPYLNIDEE